MIGRFIWSGHGIIRISLHDLKLKKLFGGLGLTCIDSMNRALLCSQCIRLLKRGDKKSIMHIDFWMGSLLANVVPSMGTVVSDMNPPEYFSFLGDCLATLMVSDVLNTSSIRVLTNRVIYSNILKLAEPKIVQDNPDFNYMKVWERIQSPSVSCENHDLS